MSKTKKSKKKKDFKKWFEDFKKSSKPIIIVLILISITLLIYSKHLIKTSKTYMFSGKSDYVTILNGVISLNHDVNLIQGSDIKYTSEEDYVVINYEIGYYVMSEGKLIPLVIKAGQDDEGFSLKGILSEISAYNIIEPYHNDSYFTKESIKALENGLYFIINVETVDDEIITDKIELVLQKVSK